MKNNISKNISYYLFLAIVLFSSCQKVEALFKNKVASETFKKIEGKWKVKSYTYHYINHFSAGWMGFVTLDDSKILYNDTLIITDDNYLNPDSITKSNAYYEFNFYQLSKKELRFAINRYCMEFFPNSIDKTYYSTYANDWKNIDENILWIIIDGRKHQMTVNGNQMSLRLYQKNGFIEYTEEISEYELEKI